MAVLVRPLGKILRSLKDGFELTLLAADLKRHVNRGRGVIGLPIAGADEPLRQLRTVAIYSANASGKSTVLIAERAMNWLATESSS